MNFTKTVCLLLAAASITAAIAAEQAPLLDIAGNFPFVTIWPAGKMPCSKGIEVEEVIERERWMAVAQPAIYPAFPSRDDNSGAAVLIIPGGGYSHETYNLGGMQYAKWFNTQGIAAFVLKYRMPDSPDLTDRQLGPIQDAQRAMQVIRANAEAWGIDKDKLGVMATSAGGHLAALLATEPEDLTTLADSVSEEAVLPDFQILISPVITMGALSHKGSRALFLGENPTEELEREYSCELRVKESTPVAFLAHADNDSTVPPMNSINYASALMEKKVSVSLHIFTAGGHGIGLRNKSACTDLWMDLCVQWMKEKEIIP